MFTSHRQLRARPLLCTVALVASSWFGCTQGEGESCQADSDCDEGLVCNRGADPRGVCGVMRIDSGTVDPGDGSTDPELPPDDAGSDAGSDAGRSDAGPVDAGTDAAPPDAAPPADSGPPADAASEMDSGS